MTSDEDVRREAEDRRKESSDVRRLFAENERQRARAIEEITAHNDESRASYAHNQSEATKRFIEKRSDDPFPKIQPSLLNSADIADYVRTTGMVYPFHPDKLKTASYEVRLLGKWTFVDKKGEVQHGELREGDRFVLKRNSIAFMTAEPLFQLPDYIALRHNLKINHVYKGLLVGTGPLIDPGFTGRISLPIHNLTENDYELHGGDGIIWVEFTKLSSNKNWDRRRKDEPRRGFYRMFPPGKTREKDVFEYISDATNHLPVPSSSSAKIATDSRRALKTARRAEKAVRTNTRALTIGGVVALVGLSASLIAPVVVDLRSRVQELEEQVQVENSTPPMPGPTPTPTPTPTPAPSSPPGTSPTP